MKARIGLSEDIKAELIISFPPDLRGGSGMSLAFLGLGNREKFRRTVLESKSKITRQDAGNKGSQNTWRRTNMLSAGFYGEFTKLNFRLFLWIYIQSLLVLKCKKQPKKHQMTPFSNPTLQNPKDPKLIWKDTEKTSWNLHCEIFKSELKHMWRVQKTYFLINLTWITADEPVWSHLMFVVLFYGLK